MPFPGWCVHGRLTLYGTPNGVRIGGMIAILGTPALSHARRRRHEDTRREILDAAWSLAEEMGIGGVSIRELARRVGLRAPSLYTYIASKDELFDAMFVEGYLQLEEAAERWTDETEELQPEQALAAVLVEWIRFCQASPARYQLMFTRAVPGWAPSAEAYAVSQRLYRKMAENLASLGISGDADVDLYTAMSAGLAAQQIANDPTGDRWVRLAPAAAHLLMSQAQRRNP